MIRRNWMSLAPYMQTEWEQSRDEGRDVAQYEQACRDINANPENREEEAKELYMLLQSAPVLPGYEYSEPSEYDAILAARPAKKPSLPAFSMTKEQYTEKVLGALLGRVAGCALGKPVEGFRRETLLPMLRETGNYPMTRYIKAYETTPSLIEKYDLRGGAVDTLKGAALSDDDTNYTALMIQMMREYGYDFTPDDALGAWLNNLPYAACCTAERVAYRNGACNMRPPQTATHFNPFREWIGAQIRADAFGYVCPGDPERAAALAWKDACISHVKNGIYGEMFVAAMLAAAAVTDDINLIIAAGLAEIPEVCRLARDIEKVLGWQTGGLSAEDAIEEIHKAYDEHKAHDWCHTNSNAMIVVMSMLYGEGELGKTICLATQAAFDTDCNAATAGSVAGMILGAAGIPAVWTEPFGDRLGVWNGEVSVRKLAGDVADIIFGK